ncbi:MAG TPA: ABC transporter permease [Bacteroidia bacterium]|jgi:lipopolysaccharide transport system permease protein|nr:ABC transporter permease [Bacteroidia bacterium]
MQQENWDLVIKSKSSRFSIDLASIWKYRDLLILLVRRDFVSVYRQTVLGPVWFFIQPILTTITLAIIGGIAGISTEGIPRILFYLSGITLWNYFADCLNKTSNTFVANASVFGKVYFPRMVVPISVIISNLIKFIIQFSLFIGVWIYYQFKTDIVHPQWSYMWVFPVLVLIMAGLGLGFGIFISSLTTKYRDFTFLVGFGVQLMMYASPIVYPIKLVTAKFPQYTTLFLINPVSSIIEAFKFIFLGSGYFNFSALLYSFCFMVVLLLISTFIFNKVEKTFMDTV